MTESREHRFLKAVALVWLRQNGYLWLGTEIHLPLTLEALHDPHRQEVEKMMQLTLGGVKQTWHNRFVVDCVGLRNWYPEGWNAEHRAPPLWACGIEAKISRNDLLSGFCFDKLNLHYIIAPEHVVPKSFLPKRVGLLEVGEIRQEYNRLVGVRVSKRATAFCAEIKGLERIIPDLCRHASTELVRHLKDELPKRQVEFKNRDLPKIAYKEEPKKL